MLSSRSSHSAASSPMFDNSSSGADSLHDSSRCDGLESDDQGHNRVHEQEDMDEDDDEDDVDDDDDDDDDDDSNDADDQEGEEQIGTRKHDPVRHAAWQLAKYIIRRGSNQTTVGNCGNFFKDYPSAKPIIQGAGLSKFCKAHGDILQYKEVQGKGIVEVVAKRWTSRSVSKGAAVSSSAPRTTTGTSRSSQDAMPKKRARRRRKCKRSEKKQEDETMMECSEQKQEEETMMDRPEKQEDETMMEEFTDLWTSTRALAEVVALYIRDQGGELHEKLLDPFIAEQSTMLRKQHDQLGGQGAVQLCALHNDILRFDRSKNILHAVQESANVQQTPSWSDWQQPAGDSWKRKTAICFAWQEGRCKFKDARDCNFAHGEDDLVRRGPSDGAHEDTVDLRAQPHSKWQEETRHSHQNSNEKSSSSRASAWSSGVTAEGAAGAGAEDSRNLSSDPLHQVDPWKGKSKKAAGLAAMPRTGPATERSSTSTNSMWLKKEDPLHSADPWSGAAAPASQDAGTADAGERPSNEDPLHRADPWKGDVVLGAADSSKAVAEGDRKKDDPLHHADPWQGTADAHVTSKDHSSTDKVEEELTAFDAQAVQHEQAEDKGSLASAMLQWLHQTLHLDLDDTSLWLLTLDIGSTPKVYRMSAPNQAKREALPLQPPPCVTEDDIARVVKATHGTGKGGHPIGDLLHRASILQSDNNSAVHGVSLRFQWQIKGSSALLQDLLDDNDIRSMLLVGPPRSGKRTLLRDIARVLAKTSNVLVLDVAGELGGFGQGCRSPFLGECRHCLFMTRVVEAEALEDLIEDHCPDIVVVNQVPADILVQCARVARSMGAGFICTAVGLLSLQESKGFVAAGYFDAIVELSGTQFGSCRVARGQMCRSADGKVSKQLAIQSRELRSDGRVLASNT